MDDEEANIALLASLLEDEGYGNVACTHTARTAVELYQSFQPDLVLRFAGCFDRVVTGWIWDIVRSDCARP